MAKCKAIMGSAVKGLRDKRLTKSVVLLMFIAHVLFVKKLSKSVNQTY